MPNTTALVSQSRPRSPTPIDHDISSPSSPSYTQSTSSHKPTSSLPDTASSPELDSKPSELPTLAEPAPEFRPAPSFSIARAPLYPGWNPNAAVTHARHSIFVKPPSGQVPTPPTSAGLSPPSPSDAVSQSTPAAPRFTPTKPLSPNHLAKIASAFGVQVPMPVNHRMNGQANSMSRSVSGPPRPSSAQSSRVAQQSNRINTATRFLLSVIPPAYLAPEGSLDRFRRGTLIPLHATLPSQLTAIAREYSLPSTVGLVVYLLDVKHDVFGEDEIGEEWLGPKIGDEAWKLLWTRMLKAERDEFERTMALQRQAMTPTLGSITGLPHSASSPHLPSTNPAASIEPVPSAEEPILQQPTPDSAKAPPLRPLITAQNRAQAAKDKATISHIRLDSTTTRSDSPSVSSIRSATTAPAPFLPSLPIVGKIEFEIDRAKATWWENWNKRPRSRTDAPIPAPPVEVPKTPKTPLPLQLRADATSPGRSSRKVPPSPLQSLSANLEVEAAKASSNLLTPASAASFPPSRNGSDVSGQPSPGWPGKDMPEDSEAEEAAPEAENEYEQLDDTDDVGSGDEVRGRRGEDSTYPSDDDVEEAVQIVAVDGHSTFAPADYSIATTPQRGDPLGDVFQEDSETWSEMQSGRPTNGSSSSHVLHPDRAEFLGQTTSDNSSFTDEAQGAPSSAVDFQEVFDMLNAKTNGPDASLADLSFGDFPVPTLTTPTGAVPQLRSPIVLEEGPASPESEKSHGSLASGDSAKGRRPAPLILGPSDKIPSILEALQPSPPGSARTPMDGDLSTPLPRRQSLGDGSFMDEFDVEQVMQKELDELERSINSLSPRELAPEPVLEARSPVERAERASRRGTPGSWALNGANGPRFRSEALGAALANKMAGLEGSASPTLEVPTRASGPAWPAVPFERGSTSLPGPSRPPVNPEAVVSEETRLRALGGFEENGALRKYRPSTPGTGLIENPLERPNISVVTSVPPRVSSLQQSPKGSSRFSADSASAASATDENKATGVTKGIRKLWRKSGAAAQATVRLQAMRNKSREESAILSLPVAPQPRARPSLDVRGERPDSSQDPFFFDRQSAYATTLRSNSPNVMTPTYRTSQAGDGASGNPKTRSILKGSRISQPTTQDDGRGKTNFGAAQRRPPPVPEERERQNEWPGGRKTGKPDALDVNGYGNAGVEVTIGGRPINGQKLSPSAFPRTASSRTSFDMEETSYRPSMESTGEPTTPRLSEFEIVSPPIRSFELEDEDHRFGLR